MSVHWEPKIEVIELLAAEMKFFVVNKNIWYL